MAIEGGGQEEVSDSSEYKTVFSKGSGAPGASEKSQRAASFHL